MRRTALTLTLLFAAVTPVACGGQPQLSQDEHYDIVECSLAGWGVRNMPRKFCEQQGGLSLTPERYRGPGPYSAPTIEERRRMEQQPR